METHHVYDQRGISGKESIALYCSFLDVAREESAPQGLLYLTA